MFPFCRNRATLLEALAGGGRHGFDEPYIGKGERNMTSKSKH